MFVYEIVYQVQESFKGLRTRLSERTRKSKTWWGSHGLEPRSLNPDSGGNPSAVDAYFDYCDTYEATATGAGLMLSELVAAALRSRYTEPAEEACQRELRRDVLKEASEALYALDDCDFEDANIQQMKAIQIEVQEMVNKGSQVVGHIIAIIRQKEVSRAGRKTVEKFRRDAA